MFLMNAIQEIVDAGAQQLLAWVTELLPKTFMFLILLNAVTGLIGRARVERLAARCSSNAFLRYMVLPFLSAVVLGNPLAISMGRYLPERYKPAYFASASYHCHTNSGIFQHINPAELFLWLGIANGVLARGYDLFPLAIRYLLAGLAANFVSGCATEWITRRVEKKQGIRLENSVELWTEAETSAGPADASAGAAGTADDSAGVSGTAAEISAEGTSASKEHAAFRTITIVRGDGGYGGPLTITPTPERHKVLYMTGGGLEPEPLARIVALSGMEAVNGNLETCPDEEVALAIIDCGGTLRCGIYPGKGIPTVNILATGKSGPLAKYMTEDLYVSAVTSEGVSAVEEAEAAGASMAMAGASAEKDSGLVEDGGMQAESKDESVSDVPIESGDKTSIHNFLAPVIAVSKVVSLFQQSAREAVRTCLETHGRKPAGPHGNRDHLLGARPERGPGSGRRRGADVLNGHRRTDRFRQCSGCYGTSGPVRDQLPVRLRLHPSGPWDDRGEAGDDASGNRGSNDLKICYGVDQDTDRAVV